MTHPCSQAQGFDRISLTQDLSAGMSHEAFTGSNELLTHQIQQGSGTIDKRACTETNIEIFKTETLKSPGLAQGTTDVSEAAPEPFS